MENLLPILCLIVGAAAGAGVAWLVLRSRIADAADTARQDGENAARQEALTEKTVLDERLTATTNQMGELRARLEKTEAEAEATIEALRKENRANAEERASLRTQLEEQRKTNEEKMALLEEARDNLTNAFNALASKALQANNESFLKLANEALGKQREAATGDLEKRRQAVEQLVKPIRESLEKVDSEMRKLEKERAGAYAGLTQQVRSLAETQASLRDETGRLATALRAPQTRGRWGEIQLRRVVEMAGMLSHCDFVEQASATTDEGARLRPDMIIRLPHNKTIVVDAKTPLVAYLDALEAPNEEEREAHLKRHARHVREHFVALGRKQYWDQFKGSTPELVVLFIPGEVFFSAALSQDPGLIEFGLEQHVLLASPTTLIALLRSVDYGWQQEKIAESAQEISDLGRELYERLRVVSGYLDGVGANLGKAVGSYNQAVRSIESRVLVTARKFKDHGAATEKEIDAPREIDQAPRDLQAEDLRTLSPPESGGSGEADG